MKYALGTVLGTTLLGLVKSKIGSHAKFVKAKYFVYKSTLTISFSEGTLLDTDIVDRVFPPSDFKEFCPNADSFDKSKVFSIEDYNLKTEGVYLQSIWFMINKVEEESVQIRFNCVGYFEITFLTKVEELLYNLTEEFSKEFIEYTNENLPKIDCDGNAQFTQHPLKIKSYRHLRSKFDKYGEHVLNVDTLKVYQPNQTFSKLRKR